MYVIFSINRVRTEHLDEFLEGVRELARNSSREPGCERYEVLQSREDPHIVCLYEVFEDETAYAIHQAADYHQVWLARSRNWRHNEEHIRHVLDYVYGPEFD